MPRQFMFTGCALTSIPKTKTSKDGNPYLVFTVIDEDSEKPEPSMILLFDDERQNSPYKRAKTLVDKGVFKKGFLINISGEITNYEEKVLPDKEWKKLSKEENPTEVTLTCYKALDWCPTIPLKTHKKFKKAQEFESKKVVIPLDIIDDDMSEEFGA